MVEDRHPGAVGVRDPDELNLPNHDRTRGARREPAPLPGHPSRVRGGRDHARLLDRHRDQVVARVDGAVRSGASKATAGVQEVATAVGTVVASEASTPVPSWREASTRWQE